MDPINTNFNHQDLLNSITVYSDDTLLDILPGAIGGINYVDNSSIELSLELDSLAGFEDQELWVVYDDTNTVLTTETGSEIYGFNDNFWLGDDNSWSDTGNSGEFDYADFDSTNNTVSLYFFEHINTSFNANDLINSLTVRIGENDGTDAGITQPGSDIPNAIIGINYIDSTSIELELHQSVIDSYSDQELWVEYDDVNNVLTTDSGMEIGWFDSSFGLTPMLG